MHALLAVLAVAVAARVEVALPGTPVPQSLQTLAVVLAGALLGPRRGAGALALYVLAGAVGVPVFAGGASGVDRLTGPTGGFLAGFVAGAAVAGAWTRRSGGRPREWSWIQAMAWSFAGMALAHAVILAAGWGRLALALGGGSAWQQGVSPFLVGGIVKAAMAAAALTLLGSHPRAGRGRVDALTPRPRSG